MDIEKSLLPTSETYFGAILSDTKIPQMFETTSVDNDTFDNPDTRFRSKKEKSLETALPEEESSFKGTVISSDYGANIIKDIDKAIALKQPRHTIPLHKRNQHLKPSPFLMNIIRLSFQVLIEECPNGSPNSSTIPLTLENYSDTPQR